MKCLCGFERKWFTLLTNTPKLRTVYDEEGFFKENIRYNEYACPECGTMRIEDIEEEQS